MNECINVFPVLQLGSFTSQKSEGVNLPNYTATPPLESTYHPSLFCLWRWFTVLVGSTTVSCIILSCEGDWICWLLSLGHPGTNQGFLQSSNSEFSLSRAIGLVIRKKKDGQSFHSLLASLPMIIKALTIRASMTLVLCRVLRLYKVPPPSPLKMEKGYI